MTQQNLARLQELDRVLHERSRLAIVSILATAESLIFKELRDTLQMTDGNLSVHLRVLEEAGYVAIDKSFVGKRPQTRVALSPVGRAALARYLDDLEAMIQQVRQT